MQTWISRLDLAMKNMAEAGTRGLSMSILGQSFLTMYWGGMTMQDSDCTGSSASQFA